MTKSDLIDALASDTGLSKADADRFLKSFTSNVEKALKKGVKRDLGEHNFKILDARQHGGATQIMIEASNQDDR